MQRDSVWRQTCTIILWCALFLSVILRVWHLPFMEFKGDEFSSIIAAFQNIHFAPFATVGPSSSLGLNHPPFSIYVFSLPLLFTADPVWIAFFIAVLNILGVILLFAFLKIAFSKETALWATALFASSPWSVILSRKIWNPDLVFPCIAVCLLGAALYILHRRPWQLLLSAAGFFLATQMHLSGWFLLPGFVVFFFLRPVRISWKWVCPILGIGLLLYAPYIVHYAVRDPGALRHFLGSRAGHSRGDPIADIQMALDITTGLRFEFLLGSGYDAFIRPIGLFPAVFRAYELFGVCALLWGGVRVMRTQTKRGESLRHPLLLLLILLFLSAQVLHYALGTPVFAHYYVITYPTIAVCTVLLAESLQGWRKNAVRLFLLAVISAHIVFAFAFFHFIVAQPEAVQGDYGKPYATDEARWQNELRDALKNSVRN